MNWDEKLMVAARCGISESDFWACTPKYLFMRNESLMEGQRLGWEQTRYLSYIMLKTVDSKNKIRKPQDVCKFPWEQEVPRFVKQSKEQLQAFSDEADEILRITQPEVYKKYMEAKAQQNGGTAT